MRQQDQRAFPLLPHNLLGRGSFSPRSPQPRTPRLLSSRVQNVRVTLTGARGGFAGASPPFQRHTRRFGPRGSKTRRLDHEHRGAATAEAPLTAAERNSERNSGDRGGVTCRGTTKHREISSLVSSRDFLSERGAVHLKPIQSHIGRLPCLENKI